MRQVFAPSTQVAVPKTLGGKSSVSFTEIIKGFSRKSNLGGGANTVSQPERNRAIIIMPRYILASLEKRNTAQGCLRRTLGRRLLGSHASLPRRGFHLRPIARTGESLGWRVRCLRRRCTSCPAGAGRPAWPRGCRSVGSGRSYL